jgi:hypothetical protein
MRDYLSVDTRVGTSTECDETPYCVQFDEAMHGCLFGPHDDWEIRTCRLNEQTIARLEFNGVTYDLLPDGAGSIRGPAKAWYDRVVGSDPARVR